MGKYTPDSDPNVVKIGFVYNMNGFSNYTDEQGAQFAIEEINADGGVNGRNLELLVSGDRADSVSGFPGTNSLISQNVVAIVGGPTSGIHMRMVQFSAPARVPLITMAATSPLLSNLTVNGQKISGSLSWRVPPSDALQGRVLAQQIQAMSLPSLGVIYRQDAYGQGLHDAFVSNYTGNVATDVPYDANKTSGFSTEVAALLGGSPPKGILILGLTPDSVAITWELQAQLQGVPLANRPSHYFAGDGASYSSFPKSAAPSTMEGMYGTIPAHPTTSAWDRFAGLFSSRTDIDPSISYAPQAYDAVYLMALAMAKGQANTSAAIVANIGSVSRPSGSSGDVVIHPGEFAKAVQALRAGQSINYEGASGNIDFDANGDPTSATYAWWRIQNGAFVTLQTIQVP